MASDLSFSDRVGRDRIRHHGDRVFVDAACEMPDWAVSRYRPVAVVVAGTRHAVRAAEPGPRGRWRYELSPWRADDGERPSREIVYDADYVEIRDHRRHSEQVGTAASWLALPVVPLLGLLPSGAKARLEGRIAFEPRSATRISVAFAGLLCAALGALLTIHWMTRAVLPPGLEWLSTAFPLLVLDTLVRHGGVRDDTLPAWGLFEWTWPPSWRRRSVAERRARSSA